MKYMLKKFQSEEGFDLVQVLVTVAILAVIATIAVLALIGQLSKGDAAATKSNINQAITAAQIALTEGGDAESAASGVNGVTAAMDDAPDDHILVITGTDGFGAEVNTNNGAVSRTGGW